MDEKALEALTPRQREAYALYTAGMTYRAAGAAMGITGGAVRRMVIDAQRRLRAYEDEQQRAEQGRLPVDFPLTYDQLELVAAALDIYEQVVVSRTKMARSSGWRERLPHDCLIADPFLKRRQLVLYDRSFRQQLRHDCQMPIADITQPVLSR